MRLPSSSSSTSSVLVLVLVLVLHCHRSSIVDRRSCRYSFPLALREGLAADPANPGRGWLSSGKRGGVLVHELCAPAVQLFACFYVWIDGCPVVLEELHLDSPNAELSDVPRVSFPVECCRKLELVRADLGYMRRERVFDRDRLRDLPVGMEGASEGAVSRDDQGRGDAEETPYLPPVTGVDLLR